MKINFSKLMFVGMIFSNILSYSQQKNMPITETYLSSSRVRSGIAMGGIGTGSIELRKDGNFYNWSIFNNAPNSSGPFMVLPTVPLSDVADSYMFFLVRYCIEGQAPKLKLLQLNQSIQEAGMEGIIYYYPWLSGVDKIDYSARFPFSNLVFSDPEMPFVVEMEAFSPFIPHDVKNSSLPGVYFNFKIKATTDKKVEVMLLGTLRNLVGYDNIEKTFKSRILEGKNYKFFEHSVIGLDSTSSSFGQMGLGVIGGEEVSYYLGWENKHPYYEKLLIERKLANIDDTQGRNMKLPSGKTVGRLGGNDNDQRCFSSIAVSHTLNGMNSEFSNTFFMNWNFPNRYGAVASKDKKTFDDRKNASYTRKLKLTKLIGHYYQNSFDSIRSIVDYFAKNNAELGAKSHQFVNDMYSSDLELFVLNQVNSQLNTFISSTVFTKSGQFGIREGLTTNREWGPNSTMDVLLYASPMIVGLFPELQKSMMRTHAKLQDKSGGVNHGLGFDLDFNQNGTWGVYERVDLVPNYIQMVLRDYLWTNDKQYMREMWPTIKLGIEYILTDRDKNGDQMPDMNGIMCSYDNFPMYGLASYIQSQWLVALTMASDVALDMGDKALSAKYKAIATKGSKLMEDKLWNGSYYILSNDYLGSKGIDNACLTDQLIGQWVANNSGLGYVFDKNHVSKSLQSIMNYSFMNNSFLRNCTWPAYPELYPIHTSDLWVDQANTPWTGVELAFASFLIQENQLENGLKVIKGVDDRYRKAGLYFDHQEFGGHYLRPMSAWSILTAFLGYSVNRDHFTFDPKLKSEAFSLFFSTPNGTALYKKSVGSVCIEVKSGEMIFDQLTFKNSSVSNPQAKIYINNKMVKNVKLKSESARFTVTLPKAIKIAKGSVIVLK